MPISTLPIDSFAVAWGGDMTIDGSGNPHYPVWNSSFSYRRNNTKIIESIRGGLEEQGWTTSADYKARLSIIATPMPPSIDAVWPAGMEKLHTAGVPLVGMDNIIVLLYDASYTQPDDDLAAAAWLPYGVPAWHWLPLYSPAGGGTALMTHQLALGLVAGGFRQTVEPGFRGIGWTITLEAPAGGTDYNDRQLWGNPSYLVPDATGTYGGGYTFESAANPTCSNAQYKLGFRPTQWRQLQVDFIDPAHTVDSPNAQFLIATGDDLPLPDWARMFYGRLPVMGSNFNLSNSGMVDPMRVIANPYQFLMFDASVGDGSSGSALVGGRSLFATCPWIPAHQQVSLGHRGGISYCALCVGPGGAKNALYWHNSGNSNIVSVSLNGTSFNYTFQPWQQSVPGEMLPTTVNRKPLVDSAGEPIEWNAWIQIPPAAGAESRVVGKWWDGLVTSKEYPLNSFVAGDPARLAAFRCVTCDQAFASGSRGSLFISDFHE